MGYFVRISCRGEQWLLGGERVPDMCPGRVSSRASCVHGHTRQRASRGLLSVNGAWGESFEGTKGEIGE